MWQIGYMKEKWWKMTVCVSNNSISSSKAMELCLLSLINIDNPYTDRHNNTLINLNIIWMNSHSVEIIRLKINIHCQSIIRTLEGIIYKLEKCKFPIHSTYLSVW